MATLKNLPFRNVNHLMRRLNPGGSANAASRILDNSYGHINANTSGISPSHPSRRSYSATTKTNKNPVVSLFTDAVTKYSISQQQDRAELASNLYGAAQHQAHNPSWYGEEGIQTDFRPVHALLSMHVWFLHRRLLAENNDPNANKTSNLLLQEELFETFWNDTKSRIRAQGVNELTVNKHLKDAQRATFVHCTQYDHAFAEFPDDVEKRFEVVCDAVWKHVLGGDEDADEELIRKIGAYVEYQLENIVYKLPDAYWEDGKVCWGNIPDLDLGLGSGGAAASINSDSAQSNADTDSSGADDTDDNSSKNLTGMKFMENDWVQVLTDAGDPYYWNLKSNKTTWSEPQSA